MKYEYIHRNDADFHLFYTKKYKTQTITIKFMSDLTKENVTLRALLPYVIKAACEKYPTKRDMSKRCEELFDVSIRSLATSYGNKSLITFQMSFMNEKYVSIAKDLTNECFSFFSELLFHPLIQNDGFKEEIVEEEKRLLEEDILGIEENKNQKALLHFLDAMMEGKIITQSFGYLEDLSKINGKNLYQAYLDMLSKDMIDVVVNGDLLDNEKEKIFQTFTFNNQNHFVNPIYDVPLSKEVKTTIEEDLDLEQANLMLGYKTIPTQGTPDFYAFNLMVAILGQTPESKLFLNVREKESLCYYISCQFNTFLGTGYIYAGINSTDFEKVISIVEREIQGMKKGEINEEEITVAKKSIKNTILESEDSPYQAQNRSYTEKIFHRPIDTNKMVERYMEVTKEDIVKMAKTLELKTKYMLRGKENE